MPATIMIVDDSGTVRQRVSLALESAGYRVVEAVDGDDALRKIRALTDLSMVICDVNMPRMNGLDMLAALRAEPAQRNLPVVMLTTEGEPELVERAKALGAKAWVVKPFKPELLIAAVKKILGG
jgi:two-component system chemotaxis response regulator CheY